MNWQRDRITGMSSMSIPAVRLEVYPPDEADPDWFWMAFEWRSGHERGRGHAVTEQDAQRAALAHA